MGLLSEPSLVELEVHLQLLFGVESPTALTFALASSQFSTSTMLDVDPDLGSSEPASETKQESLHVGVFEKASLGMSLDHVQGANGKLVVVVMRVAEGSQAATQGVQKGMQLHAINGTQIDNMTTAQVASLIA